jgi:hypothetical protein
LLRLMIMQLTTRSSPTLLQLLQDDTGPFPFKWWFMLDQYVPSFFEVYQRIALWRANRGRRH